MDDRANKHTCAKYTKVNFYLHMSCAVSCYPPEISKVFVGINKLYI